MAAISYFISVGGNLESVVANTQAPSGGQLEIRFDQTATTVSDANYPGGKRAPQRGELLALLRTLEEYLIRDTNVLGP